jgi:hypothetical protein
MAEDSVGSKTTWELRQMDTKERIEESELGLYSDKRKVANVRKKFCQLAVSPKKRQI